MSIESISQNNYVLATQQAVTHDESMSGNGTVESPLGVVPGYNETVLYEGSANYNLIQLSEPASNFERIMLYISTTRPSIFEYPSFTFTNNTWPGGQFGAGWGGKPSMTVFELSSNDNSFKVNAGWHTESTASVNWTTLNVSSTWIRPFKVIGINRKQ